MGVVGELGLVSAISKKESSLAPFFTAATQAFEMPIPYSSHVIRLT